MDVSIGFGAETANTWEKLAGIHVGNIRGHAQRRSRRLIDRQAATKRRALVALSDGATIERVASTAGVTRQSLSAWRRRDPDFANAWDVALGTGLDKLETKMATAAPAERKGILIQLSLHRPHVWARGNRASYALQERVPVELQDAISRSLSQMRGAVSVVATEAFLYDGSGTPTL